MMADGELGKLQRHLALLHNEYVKLQKKYDELEKKHNLLVASSGEQDGEETFVSRLLTTVADLYDEELYSDLIVTLEGGHKLKAHKFVLTARSTTWGVPNLNDVSSLDFSDVPLVIGQAMMNWVYTDKVDLQGDEDFILNLMQAASKFQLKCLIHKCENALMRLVKVGNCIKYFQTADSLGASALKNHCSQLISLYWNDFTSEDFASMSAPLLYSMFKSKSEFPLHTAIRALREDVVFLYLVENNAEVVEGMCCVAALLLSHNADPNVQDSMGRTALHCAVVTGNERVFSLLLENQSLNLELRNLDGFTPLWVALQQHCDYQEKSLSARLVARGSSTDAVCPKSGDSLLHLAARSGNGDAALFLVKYGAQPGLVNNRGETALHCACQTGLAKLVAALLLKGANPNAQTQDAEVEAVAEEEEEEEGAVGKQTPLHVAIRCSREAVVNVFLEHKRRLTESPDNKLVIPNFNVKDSRHETVLSLALWLGLHDIAAGLLAAGADIDCKDAEGNTLLHQAIIKQDSRSALFLLDHSADITSKTVDEETPLELSIKRHLPIVVDALCQKGANTDEPDSQGNSPLWKALETGQEDIGSVLVKHRCDTTAWSRGPDGCEQTLLHRAIDENNEAVACFLIRSICDINSPRRPGPNGEGGEEAYDGQTPLHLACQWGQELVVHSLLEQGANVNIRDAEGKTPIHIAISNQHQVIISLLLLHPGLDLTVRDKRGLTPFAAAMTSKNNNAAQAILQNEPTAAEQCDNKGRNFLHVAIQKADIESVLFLISVHASVNTRIQDSHQLTPLHLAVIAGCEMIVRNLLLAFANIDDVTHQKQTALHLAAAHDQQTICAVLIENKIDYNAVDDNLNNALHIAAQKGNLGCVRILLTESRINAEVINMRGQTPMHMLGRYGKENAAAIFDLFMECMPEYQLDKPDVEGNTVLLLAYLNGNVNLCKALVRAGAQLGNTNKQGVSIFNAQVATKQLLFRLLDLLSREPPWTEGENCNECGVKFRIANRKHHCRHCGRLLCNKCSSKVIPILKFDQTKPVRACSICFDVLTLGS
ncbi:PREDICTED: rabankyrin-5-like [Priapulus caudatus]|uniref:Rabankyrin-5-like n=1 Tax=Priapulus caudatus TaxID=37621 RepID=A0ABM1EEU8_PRICU|nr:PREDICTED: rabankyrin-5-like [Priapulus caudatus]